MDDVELMLARLRTARNDRSIAADPAFPARLRASARRGEVATVFRAAALGLVMAAATVLVHPLPARIAEPRTSLLTTVDGAIL